MTKPRVTWGWSSLADFASWAAGIAIAVWRLSATGTLEPGALTFVTGLLAFPMLRRAVEARVRGNGK